MPSCSDERKTSPIFQTQVPTISMDEGTEAGLDPGTASVPGADLLLQDPTPGPPNNLQSLHSDRI